MIRVTVELVPYGVEAMAKTIAELCIANTGGTLEQADYQAAGYTVRTDNKIEEFAAEVKDFTRNSGVLELIREVLTSERTDTEKVELAEQLLASTRLFAVGEETT